MLRLFRDALTRLRLLLTRFLTRIGLGEEAFLLILAFFIGVVTAAAAVGFHELIEKVRYLCFVRLRQRFDLYGTYLWMIAVLPALGGLIVGIIARYVYDGREGSSVIDVMESVGRASGGVKARSAIEKIVTSAVTIGPASRTIAITEAPPLSETAPSWRIRAPVCSAMIAPNGIATRQAGRIETLATNQHCCRNSRHWNGRRKTARPVSSDIATKLPVSRNSVVGLVTRGTLPAEKRRPGGQTGRRAPNLVRGCDAGHMPRATITQPRAAALHGTRAGAQTHPQVAEIPAASGVPCRATAAGSCRAR